jgi:hypothetical protein
MARRRRRNNSSEEFAGYTLEEWNDPLKAWAKHDVVSAASRQKKIHNWSLVGGLAVIAVALVVLYRSRRK